jgi:Calcineurin-like phosphoesterase
VRALVISDTHFGAWTGEDILRDPATVALLEPALDVDEVIFLGDMFDLLFASRREAFTAADALLDVLRERLQGKRFVFLAGNHDYHVVVRDSEELLELELATGKPPDELRGELRRNDFFRRFLRRRLEGVEVECRYPTYEFAGVLCTHGHYLDMHARRSGAVAGRLLSRTLWMIAVGGGQRTPTVDDYEATIAMLTGLLYTIAQLPNGTHAQRRAFKAFQTLGRAVHLGAAPVRAVEDAQHRLASLAGGSREPRRTVKSEAQNAGYEGARVHEAERQARTGAPAGGDAAIARTVSPSDPSATAVNAFEEVVLNLGWDRVSNQIVFAHTHQPLEGVMAAHPRVRYWNTGSWIYEPDLSSNEAYVAYLRNAWPGTAVLIDSDEPAPRLLRLREHLNPLSREANSCRPRGSSTDRS